MAVGEPSMLALVAGVQLGLWVLAPFHASLSPRAFSGFPRVAMAIIGTEFVFDFFGRPLEVATAVAMIAAVAFGRALVSTLWVSARRRGWLHQSSLVVGQGEVATELVNVLREHPEYGCLPVHRPGLAGHAPKGAPKADVDALRHVIETLNVESVFLVGGTAEVPAPDLRCEVYLVLSNDSPLAGRADDHIWGIPVVRVPRHAPQSLALRAKRAVDVIGALFGIVISSPLLALTAIAVKRTSPGPVMIRQQRIGKDGRLITVTKFRTMIERGELNLDVIDQMTAEAWQRQQHDEAKSRETRVGRFVRATSLDELPQLFDILRGDLSLVGPRPELPYQVAHYCLDVDGYANRHRMPAGLTGWAQIHGLRGETSLSERARFDNYYIDTWSFGRDLAIVVLTFSAVARHAARALVRRSG